MSSQASPVSWAVPPLLGTVCPKSQVHCLFCWFPARSQGTPDLFSIIVCWTLTSFPSSSRWDGALSRPPTEKEKMSFSPSHHISLEIHQHNAVLIWTKILMKTTLLLFTWSYLFSFLRPRQSRGQPKEYCTHDCSSRPDRVDSEVLSLHLCDTELCDEVKPDFLSFSLGLFPGRCLGPSHQNRFLDSLSHQFCQICLDLSQIAAVDTA